MRTLCGGYLCVWQDVGTLAGHTDELREISHPESVYTMVYIHMSEATQCV